MFFYSYIGQSRTLIMTGKSHHNVTHNMTYGGRKHMWRFTDDSEGCCQKQKSTKKHKNSWSHLISKKLCLEVETGIVQKKKYIMLIAKNNWSGLKVKQWVSTLRPVGVRSCCRRPCSALHCLCSQLAQLKLLQFWVGCLRLVFPETGRQICHFWNIILACSKLKSTCINNKLKPSVLLRPVQGFGRVSSC